MNTTDSELIDFEAATGYLRVLWIDLLTFICLKYSMVKVKSEGRWGSLTIRAIRIRVSPGSSRRKHLGLTCKPL